MYAIEIDSLKYQIHDKTILNALDFILPEASCCGLIGPNGAGKTSLFRVLAGLLEFQEGKVFISGRQVPGEQEQLKPNIGLYLDDLGFYNHLSIQENLLLSAYLYGLNEKETQERSQFLLELMGLRDVQTVQVSKASKGMKKKTALALSLIHNPKIILWDEPFEGIDYPSLEKIFNAVNQLTNSGRSFLIVSHIFDYLDKVITHYGMISQGSIISQGIYKKESQDLHQLFHEYSPGEKKLEELPWL